MVTKRGREQFKLKANGFSSIAITALVFFDELKDYCADFFGGNMT